MQLFEGNTLEKINIIKDRLFKELKLTFRLLLFMLLPGCILDYIYFMRNEIKFAEKMVAYLCFYLKPWGITYTNAFNIINNNIGVLLTMVSLFLTMNINIAQRSEKKIMGIPYREIEDINQNVFYKYTKRVCYLAPMLMLIVLNLHLCATGYLIFCYCYGFLIMHYYIHAGSYSMEVAREGIAKRLIRCLPQGEGRGYDELWEYDMFLEEVGRGMEEEGNWKEGELLYAKLAELSDPDKMEQRQIILSRFYKIVYWDRKNKNNAAIFRLWILSMEKSDIRIAQNGQISENDWVLLWSMLKIIICEAKENELLSYFEVFLNFTVRSNKTLEAVDVRRELPDQVLNEQSGAVMVLLEYRLRKKLPEQEQMIWYIRKLVEYGEKVFIIPDYHFIDRVKLLCPTNDKNAGEYVRMAMDLHSDFNDESTRCVITNILMNY